MTKQEILKGIRVLLGMHKFDEATLADGTKIMNDSDEAFAPGQKLYVIDSEGNRVSAPEGEHTTESGIVLTVDAEGTITGVKEPDAEGEGALEAGKEEKMQDEEIVEKVADALTPELIMEIVTPIVEEVAAMKKEVEAMKKEFEEYKNGPAKESMKKSFSKLNFNKTENEVIDAYSRIADLRREFYKK
jgi:hypothetical protein